MSIRNLDAIFRPKSIALVGASNRPNSVGSVLAKNLLAGGFDGPIMPVNPKHQSVSGVLCYPSAGNLPLVPDLAVVCTPPHTVPNVITELGSLGTKGAIVITAGFRELGNTEGRALEDAMLAAAKPHLLRVIGPNCLGVLSTPVGINATFAPEHAKKGGVAFIAQSGAMVTTVLDWGGARGIGFSHLVSLGDMADVDFGDMLDYLATDTATTAILLYIEGVTSTRKFMSAARAAARLKPVIAIKAGRHEAAAKAATSHTGALAGIDAVYDTAFRRAGILRVMDLEELFSAVETLAAPTSFSGEALVVLTNGGGAGVLATDALADAGGKLTALAPQTVAKLGGVLPPTWSKSNPIDIIGDAPGKRYADALDIVLGAPETSAVLVLNCPTAIASGIDAAKAVVETVKDRPGRVLTNWLGTRSAAEARSLFSAAKIPTFDTPTQAVRGFMHVVRYRQGQNRILEVPSSRATDVAPDTGSAREIVDTALVSASGAEWLADDGVRGLLNCYGIPTVQTKVVADADEAALAAREFAVPVVLKIRSPDITHKTEVGGVALNLAGADVVREAANAMLARVATAAPNSRVAGFVVQEMIQRPDAFELIAGMAVDAQFGPFLLFGHGGTAVEVIADKALALPPLNLSLARELISQTRIFRQLQGYRNRPAVALDAIAMTLVRLSQLICDFDEIVEIDINPFLSDSRGVVALDARIRIEHPASCVRGGRLAIRPYPRELERTESLPGLGEMTLRPIRPEDAAGLMDLVGKLTPEDLRLRFFAPIRHLQPRQLMRLTQIDYDREMALVLTPAGTNEIFAIARLISDPDICRAEFAIVVRSDLHHRGMGQLLMTRLIEYARRRGLEELFGDVLQENAPMLGLCRKLGLTSAGRQTPDAVRFTLKL